MIGMWSHVCDLCSRGWAATFRCATCPYCDGCSVTVKEMV